MGPSMKPNRRSSVRLLQYVSEPQTGRGIEVLFRAQDDMPSLFDDLQWLGAQHASPQATNFFVLTPVEDSAPPDLRMLARYAREWELARKICITVPITHENCDDLLADLQESGVLLLLGAVGAHTRFSDVANPLIDGIVVDRSLISAAVGNPHAASILESLTLLTRNLGLRSFASCCVRQLDADTARACGVQFLSLAKAEQLRSVRRQTIGRTRLGPSEWFSSEQTD